MSEASQETVSSAASESGERYPDGWPVRPIDWLAAPMWAAAVDGSDDASGFGSLAEWQRDEFRYAARVAQEHYEPKLRALEAERDALREEVRSALAKYDVVYCDDGYNGDREAALAKLREAVK
jgi:hypothetical protein